MEVNPMWFVVIGVVVALVVAYRQGKLAGFVAKVKADEAKLVVDAKADLPGLAARLEAFAKKEFAAGEADAKKFGDEIAGWFHKSPTAVVAPVAAAPAVAVPDASPSTTTMTLTERVESIKAALDALKPKA